MIGQTIAIFIDAYRDLNSRKLFWITLILSAVFIGLFGIIGIDEQGMQVLFKHFDMPAPQAQYMYKYTFKVVVIGIWLTWAATVLALISTMGIFPDLITGGSIELYLSKPLSRARLFMTKYLTGLTFVAFQVIVVTVGGFLVMGIRGHIWLPQLFLAVPIVICFFSYLFAICVFFGVLTRSSTAALLLTIGVWALLAGLDWSEPILLAGQNSLTQEAERYESRANEIAAATDATTRPDESSTEEIASFKLRAQSMRNWASGFNAAQRVTYGLKSITPKTTDTIELLTRYVYTDEDVANSLKPPGDRHRIHENTENDTEDRPGNEAAKKTESEIRSRSVAWVIGTSLAFEAVLVALAGWIFCRRDY